MKHKTQILIISTIVAMLFVCGVAYKKRKGIRNVIANMELKYCYPWQATKFSPKTCTDSIITPEMLIAHAGGAIRDSKGTFHTYTNCKQALHNAYANGYKYIELDLMLDADGDIFAAHDYARFYEITGQSAEFVAANQNTPPTKEYLRNAKILGEFDILTHEDINNFFAEHKDLILVTDKLNDFAAITEQLHFDSERILVEVFSINSYLAAKKVGIKYPMLCIYPNNDNITRVRDLNISMLTVAAWDMVKINDLSALKSFIAEGGFVATFTSNDRNFMCKHLGITSSVFYNDNYNFTIQHCEMDECTFEWK